jgi:DNA-binding CsgD family transcriptional regulator
MALSRRDAVNSGVHVTAGFEHERHADVVSMRARMKLVIVNSAGGVLLDSIDPSEHELRLLLSDDRKTFRGDIAVTVRSLIDHCLAKSERHSHIAFLDAHRFVRVTRLDGDDVPLFAVSMEVFRAADSLSRAARKYRLTPREIDVLAMVLEGASATETASALNIAETTVQGYHKRLLSKTQSRNRPAMVANVLDWGGFTRRRTFLG